MKIAIATDHNGVDQKKEIIESLNNKYEFVDKSPVNDPTDDYPDFALEVAKAVVNKDVDFGILMCGTGIGMSIAANKVKGIRAAHCSNTDQARLTRVDNDANIICLSYKQDMEELIDMIETFMDTVHESVERHDRRINKIKQIEEGILK
jgi:ribose 5-phosphate isomerase B